MKKRRNIFVKQPKTIVETSKGVKVRSGGASPYSVCQSLGGNREEYCEDMVELQCVDQLAVLCGGVHPGDMAATEQCASYDNIAWNVPQDVALRDALQNGAKRFLVNLPDLIAQTFSASSLAACAQKVADIVSLYGVPHSYFVTLDNSNIAEFAKLKEQVIVIAGKAGDPSTEELKRKAVEEFGGPAQFLFIDITNKTTAKKLMKQLGVFTAFKDTFEGDYSTPHRFDHFLIDGKWTWSPYIELQSSGAALWEAWLKKNQQEEPVSGSGNALWEAWLKKNQQQPAMQTPATPPPVAPLPSVAPPVAPLPVAPSPPPPVPQEGIKIPEAYNKVDLITQAEDYAAGQPMAGYARTLTQHNFDLFFVQTGRPVIVAVIDGSIHQQDVIQVLQDEQQIKPEAQRAFIAVLDLSNKATRAVLWNKLSHLNQKTTGLIDPEFIRPFTILEYKGGSIGLYHDVDLNSDGAADIEITQRGSPPPVQELKMEFDPNTNTKFNLFSLIKKNKVSYPMTVFVVHDPYDLQFQFEAETVRNDNSGSVFYVDWNDPESRFFATHYLGLPPLSDAHEYESWEFEKPTDEHGYFTKVAFDGAVLQTDTDLLNATALVTDPYEFRYVASVNFDTYFGETAREDSIVVVGDPRETDTQQLIERLEEEKRDLGHGLRLIMVPQWADGEVKNTAQSVLQQLGISTKMHTTAKAYKVEWNDQGKRTKVDYNPHGFESVHVDNDVWDESVLGTSSNVLVVVGETDATWDAGVAQATAQLRSGLVSQIMNSKDHSITVDKKKVKRIVYLTPADVLRIFSSEMDNPEQYSIPYEFLHNDQLPQMFLVTGPKGNRSNVVISGASDISLPVGWSPDAGPQETQVVNVVKFDAESYKKLSEMGVTEKTVTSEIGEQQIEEAFQKIDPTVQAWKMSLNKMGVIGDGRFLVVIGDEGAESVKKWMKKLMKAEGDEQLYFINTEIDAPSITYTYQTKLQEMNFFLKAVFGFESNSLPNPPVFECTQNNSEKVSYTCKPYHFPE